ncbi:MAG: CBS domain-containing protein [Sulfolobales archaeon]
MVPKVSSFMSSPVITASKEEPLINVRNLMLTHRIGRVVILEHGKVAGIVCKSDFSRIVFNRKRYLKPLNAIRVDEIMSTPVYAISPNKTLKSAAQFMLKREVSSLPVIDSNGKLVGIITKHDILKAFSSKFHNIFKVSDFMVKNPLTVSPTHSIYYVIDLLLQSEQKKVIVVDGGRPVGIITKSEILNALLGVDVNSPTVKHTHRFFKTLLYELIETHPVLIASDFMIENPITIAQDEDLAMASDIMVKNRIECLPVTDSKGFLIGLISKDNIVRALKEV